MAKRAPNARGGGQKTVERDIIPEGVDVPDRDLFFNRELSWLAFNDRVLQLAEDTAVPLLERLKFFAIYARNLDEFFMIRVARLHEQHRAGVSRLVPDGATPERHWTSCTRASASRGCATATASSRCCGRRWRRRGCACSP